MADIKKGDFVVFAHGTELYDGRVTRVAGEYFQVRRWNPFNFYWHYWLEKGRIVAKIEK